MKRKILKFLSLIMAANFLFYLSGNVVLAGKRNTSNNYRPTYPRTHRVAKFNCDPSQCHHQKILETLPSTMQIIYVGAIKKKINNRNSFHVDYIHPDPFLHRVEEHLNSKGKKCCVIFYNDIIAAEKLIKSVVNDSFCKKFYGEGMTNVFKCIVENKEIWKNLRLTGRINLYLSVLVAILHSFNDNLSKCMYDILKNENLDVWKRLDDLYRACAGCFVLLNRHLIEIDDEISPWLISINFDLDTVFRTYGIAF